MIFVYYLFGYDDNFDSPVYASLNKFKVVLLVHVVYYLFELNDSVACSPHSIMNNKKL